MGPPGRPTVLALLLNAVDRSIIVISYHSTYVAKKKYCIYMYIKLASRARLVTSRLTKNAFNKNRKTTLQEKNKKKQLVGGGVCVVKCPMSLLAQQTAQYRQIGCTDALLVTGGRGGGRVLPSCRTSDAKNRGYVGKKSRKEEQTATIDSILYNPSTCFFTGVAVGLHYSYRAILVR